MCDGSPFDARGLRPVPRAVVATWRCLLCRRPVKVWSGLEAGDVVHQCDHARFLVIAPALEGTPAVLVQTRA